MASIRASETLHVKLVGRACTLDNPGVLVAIRGQRCPNCIKKRKNKEAMANTHTTTVPVEGAIAAFHSEIKLGPCTSVFRIVLHYIIINTVYIATLYTIFRIAHQGTFNLHVFINTD